MYKKLGYLKDRKTKKKKYVNQRDMNLGVYVNHVKQTLPTNDLVLVTLPSTARKFM